MHFIALYCTCLTFAHFQIYSKMLPLPILPCTNPPQAILFCDVNKLSNMSLQILSICVLLCVNNVQWVCIAQQEVHASWICQTSFASTCVFSTLLADVREGLLHFDDITLSAKVHKLYVCCVTLSFLCCYGQPAHCCSEKCDQGNW